MIIKIQESKLFTQLPDERFAKRYGVPATLWTELWKRHMLLQYTPQDMADLYYAKTGRKIGTHHMRKWIFRTKVYMRAREAIKMDARAVTIEFFGDLGEELQQELFKNADRLKKPPKILV